MKIFYTIHQFFPTYYTGTERYLLNLSRMIQKFGHQVHIFTYQPYFENDMIDIGNLYIKNYIYDNLEVTAIRLKDEKQLYNFNFENKDIFNFFYETLKKEKPDILHITHPMCMASAFDAAKVLKIKTILTLTDFWIMCGKGILIKSSDNKVCTGPKDGINCKRYCYQFLPKKILRERSKKSKQIIKDADALIISAKFVSDFYKINNYDTSKIHIIRHGFNYFDNYLPIKIKKHRNKDFVFASLGSVIPHKGTHLLIKAFQLIKSKNIKLRIYGDANQSKEYFEYLKKIKGSDERITFEGKYSLKDVPKIHEEVDTVIQPSMWYETYPLVCVAALAYGVPIIVPDLSGAKELVTERKNGYIFKFGDEESLKEKMEQSITDQLKFKSSIFYNHTTEEEAFITEGLYKKTIERYETK